jgi:LPXTG-motif cell wall-anchored protein
MNSVALLIGLAIVALVIVLIVFVKRRNGNG